MFTVKALPILALLGAAAPAIAAPLVVASANFDTPTTTAPGVTFSGLANGAVEANSRTGNYFRNTGTGLTTVTLSGLGSHDSIDIDFSLLFLDSWDGTTGSGGVTPDYLFLTIDGTQVAQLTVNNFDNNQFSVPGGTQVGTVANFAANGSFADRLVDMSGAGYLSFAHTASSITFGVQAGGNGYQSGADESWGIDNILVTVNAVDAPAGAVPEPATWAMMLLGFGLVGTAARRRRAAPFAAA